MRAVQREKYSCSSESTSHTLYMARVRHGAPDTQFSRSVRRPGKVRIGSSPSLPSNSRRVLVSVVDGATRSRRSRSIISGISAQRPCETMTTGRINGIKVSRFHLTAFHAEIEIFKTTYGVVARETINRADLGIE